MKAFSIVLFGTIELLFLAGQSKACDPAVAAAFATAAFQPQLIQSSFIQQTALAPMVVPTCSTASFASFRAVPFSTGFVNAGFSPGFGSFNVNARRIHNSNFGFGGGFNAGFNRFGGGFNNFAGGFGGGTVNINARRIRNSNFGGIAAAAAASGANVNINARRIRRSNF